MPTSSRILVVDTEPAVRRLLADLLSGEGYVVSEASDGAKALATLRDSVPDIVITDLMMPVMSGWSFARECGRIEGCRDLAIIAISAIFNIESTYTHLQALGIRACLAKPFDVGTLLSLVASVGRSDA